MAVSVLEPIPKICNRRIDNQTVIKICCADYEEKGDLCYPCMPGFTTAFKEKCEPCGNNTYGRGCVLDCNCLPNARCHHVHGCLALSTQKILDTSTLSLPGTSSNEYFTESSRPVVSRVTRNYDDVALGGSSMVWFYTTSSATIFVLLCCVAILFMKYKKSVQKRKVVLHTQNVNTAPTDERSISEDGDYSAIDENLMADIPVPSRPRNEYLDIISGSDSSNSSINMNQSEYLQAVVHTQSQLQIIRGNNDGKRQDCDEDIEQPRVNFQNSYERLVHPSSSLNTYTLLSPLNRDHCTNTKNRSCELKKKSTLTHSANVKRATI